MSWTSASASARSVFRPQRACHRARDLRNFQSVRQPVAKVIRKPRGEDLRLGFQPPKSPRMDDAVAVPRIVVAVGMLRFWIPAAARAPHVHRVGCRRIHRRAPAQLLPEPDGRSASCWSACSAIGVSGNSILICAYSLAASAGLLCE